MKTKFLKPCYLLVLFVFAACSNQEELPLSASDYNLPEVVNKRLVFESATQLSNIIEDETLQNKLQDKLQTENFSSLKNSEQNGELEYADFIMNYYNEDGEIQIGEELILIKDQKQYIVSHENEGLFEEIKADLNNGNVPSREDLIVHEIETTIVPIEQNNTKSGWLDARYQHEFTNAGGGRYKFVFEAYLNSYYFSIGAVRITTGVRAKFEWLHGRTWKPAGENVYKSISNLRITLTPNFGAAQSVSVPGVSHISNQNLIVAGPSLNSIIGPMNYRIQVSGNFYAQLRDPRQAAYSYSQYCLWDAGVTC